MKPQHILTGIAVLAAMVLLAFGLRYGALAWERYFAPKEQNVQREVFENTKSFVHGQIQDLARYYEQYRRAETPEDKEAIAAVIKTQLVNLDAKKVPNQKLREFLVEVRGF